MKTFCFHLQSVFQIVACVLHLGNVGFLEQEGKAVLANDKSIKAIAAVRYFHLHQFENVYISSNFICIMKGTDVK